jgi:hypothetical protein
MSAQTVVTSFEATSKALQDLQDQLNLWKNQQQDLHGRKISNAGAGQNPNDLVTHQQLKKQTSVSNVPGTTQTMPVIPNLLNKANIWRRIQTFLAGIFTRFVTWFESGVFPDTGPLDANGFGQWTISVSKDASNISFPAGFWILDNTTGSNFLNREVVNINHEPYLGNPLDGGSFWNDNFYAGPSTGSDGTFDLGRFVNSPTVGNSWAGIYSNFVAIKGSVPFPGPNPGGGQLSLELKNDEVAARFQGAAQTPLTIWGHPLTLKGDDTSTNKITITDTGITIDATTLNVSIGGSPGITVTIITAALTGGGTQGSMTFTNGVLTAQVAAT